MRYKQRASTEIVPTLDMLTIVDASEYSIEMKLKFVTLEFISTDIFKPCYIQLYIQQNAIWDPVASNFANQLTIDPVDLPRMMDDEFAEIYTEFVVKTTEATTSVLNANLVINIVLGSSLKLMWGMVNTLQFISYFSEVQVS